MEYLDEAIEELKRVDHLVYVSLKYTRTVDVIKSTVGRLINAFDFAVQQLLEHAKEKKKLDNNPGAHDLRCNILQNLFPAR